MRWSGMRGGEDAGVVRLEGAYPKRVRLPLFSPKGVCCRVMDAFKISMRNFELKCGMPKGNLL
jgi:hypothetical protein